MNENPLIRFVLLFVTGIVIASQISFSFLSSFIILIMCLAVYIALSFFKHESFKIICSFLQLLMILLIGAAYFQYSNQEKTVYPFKESKYSNVTVYGKVNGLELNRNGRMILYVETDSVLVKEGMYKGETEVLCSIYDVQNSIDSLYKVLSIGNKVVLSGVLKEPREKRNPFEFDYEKYLNRKSIAAVFTSYNSNDLKITSSEKMFFKDVLFKIRQSLDVKLSELNNKTTSALLRGLLLADRSKIDYEVQDDFVNAGVVHVLSVSGLHVGYIVLIFLILFNRFNIYTRATLTIIGLLFYMVLTGSDSPVFRSTVMAIVLLTAPIMGRDYNSLNAIALAAWIILVINPNELFNPSFQLSFSAMLSLVIIYPILSKEIQKVKIKSKPIRYVVLFCASTLAAQLGTLPFTLTYFHRFSISSFVANMVVIPLSGFVVGLGILSLFIGSFFISAGQIFASANNLLTYIMYGIVRLLGQGKLAYITINQFTVYDAIIFYLALAVLLSVMKKFVNPVAKLSAVILVIITTVTFMRLDNYEMMPKDILSVMAVDVGQGNAILIRFPNGESALIDAGNATPYFDNGKRIILPLLSKMNIDAIDYGIVSHIDSDHSGGFLSLINENKVKRIIKPIPDTSSAIDLYFEHQLKVKGIPVEYFYKEKFAIGNARLYVLNDSIKKYAEPLSSNDKSGVIKLVYGNNSFLFSGDASAILEQQYSNRYNTFLHANILLVGHHGSRTSTSSKFLELVNPQKAVISVGAYNKFNHPHKETIEKLKSKGIEITRTDEAGAILFRSDGYSIHKIDWRRIESTIQL